MSSESAIPNPDALRLRERLDLALERISHLPAFDGVYLGPWWELPSLSHQLGMVGWKRAVLRRVAGGGAEHWGHLFLLYSAVGQTAGVEPESDPRVRSPRYGAVRKVGEISKVATFLVRASHPDGSPLLDLFAEQSLELLQGEGNSSTVSEVE
ncbi:MAG: hypothetical protein WB778_02205 [Thermoplasmata archaeon]